MLINSPVCSFKRLSKIIEDIMSRCCMSEVIEDTMSRHCFSVNLDNFFKVCTSACHVFRHELMFVCMFPQATRQSGSHF